MHPLYQAKEVTISERGVRRAILQDGPNHFHVTLQKDDKLLYSYYNELKDINELYDNISRLEDEFLEGKSLVGETPTPVLEGNRA